jgi:hypothetical protein
VVFDFYLKVPVTDPASFGTGTMTNASTGTGTFAAFFKSGPLGFVEVNAGYTSDTLINDSSTYDMATFASLGVRPGTYVWSWGSGADQSFTLDIQAPAAPLPASLPLFATGLGALGLLGWRRKRQARAVAA